MEKTKEYFIEMLQTTAKNEGRLPKKADFSVDDVNRIKGLFGPWPWALEAAGLKESKQEERIAKNREKRKAAKERRKCYKNAQNATKNERKCI